MLHSNTYANQSLASQVVWHTGVNSARCYQCGKCSAGCPLANDMDYTSSMVMRILQNEDDKLDKDLLQSQAIWLCASCEMCISRCPMSVDIPKVMDFLRQQSIAKGLQNKVAAKNIIPFHRSFLDMIHLTGRSYEVGLVVDYKFRSRKFLQDLMVAPKMFLKGKLSVFPERIKGIKNMNRIFKQCGINFPFSIFK
jgi:heterodisulfide reductase subunit C